MTEQDAKNTMRRVHMAHCYQGENLTVCKYGDADCPARPLLSHASELEQVRERLMLAIDHLCPTVKHLVVDTILSDPSIAILAENQELPEVFPITMRTADSRYLDGVLRSEGLKVQQDMLEAGFRKVVQK